MNILCYRKKPVVIQAIVVEEQGLISACGWCDGKIVYGPLGHPEGIRIKTLEGNMIANIGDYIIRGVMGEHYPCKPEIFKITYEEIE